MAIQQKVILLIGAYGFTGRLIADELTRRKIEFIPAGRDADKLDAIRQELALPAARVVDLLNHDQFDNILDNVDIVINCAGPYEYYSADFLQAVSHWPGTYIDLTGELNFVLRSYDELDERCRANQCLVIHSCAFESTLAELLFNALIDDSVNYERVDSYYHYRNAQVSPGTQLTAKLAEPARAQIYRHGKLRAADRELMLAEVPGSLDRDGMLAYYSPLPEVAFFSRRCHTQNAASYILMPEADARFLAGLQAATEKNRDQVVTRFKSRRTRWPEESARKRHRFQVSVVATASNGSTTAITADGCDPYGLTAVFIASTIHILLRDAPQRIGVVSPGELLADTGLLDELVKQGYLDVTRNPL